jgi:PAS domain S-box-containing protein
MPVCEYHECLYFSRLWTIVGIGRQKTGHSVSTVMNDPAGAKGARPADEAGRLRAELAAARAQIEKLGAMLREQEAFSRGVERARQAWTQTFDSLDQPIFLHDENGCIARANLAYAKRAGAPVKNLIGKVYWKLFPRREMPFEAPANEADRAEFEFAAAPGEVFLVRSFGSSAGLPPGWRLYLFQDITQLKRAEADLRASSQYARAIIDSSAAIIVAVDRDRRIIEFNPAAEQAFGYQREEVMGRHINLLYAEPDVSDTLRRMVLERPGMLGEVRNRRKNGETFTCLMSGAVMRDDEGKALGILGISLDVTEQKRAEENLHEALEGLELVFENVASGIAYVRAGVIERVNRRLADMLGFRREELVGRGVEICYASREHFEVLQREASPVLAGGRAYQGNVQLRRRDGSLLWALATGRMVDREGGADGSVWMFEDISERKAAEDRLTRSEAYFRALVESGSDLVTVVNAEGVIQYESPGAERVLGVDAAQRMGRSVYEPVHPEDLPRVREVWQRVLRGQNRRVEADFRVRHRDGTWRLAESVCSAAFDAGGELVAVIHLRDATERRRAEQRLVRGLEQTVAAIAAAAESRDAYAAGHQRAVAALAVAIGREAGLDDKQLRGLQLAAAAHDIGKLRIPVEILMKPTRLTEAEYALVRTHPQAGHDMLKGVELPWPVAQIVLQHHELLDGSGYPRGLKGDEILLEARILAVADVVAAMTAHRAHRAAPGVDAALGEIVKHRGTKYDAAAVDACVRLIREKGYKLDRT